MYCPKCGTENADDAQLCRSCSWVLTGATAAGAAAGARVSTLAITSLVLGILSFCTFFLTAPIAVILGIVSLIMISRSGGRLTGRGFAIAGIAVPVVALPFAAIMMGIMIPAFVKFNVLVKRETCAANMAAVGQAMSAYANDYDGKFPTSSEWCDLLIEYADADEYKFRCVGGLGYGGIETSRRICSYAMNENVEERGENSPHDMVLLFETDSGWNQSGGPEILTTGNHEDEGCNILFVDGSVEFVKTADLDNLTWTAEQED